MPFLVFYQFCYDFQRNTEFTSVTMTTVYLIIFLQLLEIHQMHLQMLLFKRDVKFSSANDGRNTDQNIALFFTDGLANVNALQVVSSAITTRISSGGVYVISFGVGTLVNIYELIAMSSVAGYPVMATTSQTVFRVTSYSTMSSSLSSYLTAIFGGQ